METNLGLQSEQKTHDFESAASHLRQDGTSNFCERKLVLSNHAGNQLGGSFQHDTRHTKIYVAFAR